MKKQLEKIGYKILILITLGAMAQALYADGYRNPPPTAEGIAKSGANSVFVDDASAISYNPANHERMSQNFTPSRHIPIQVPTTPRCGKTNTMPISLPASSWLPRKPF